jgi:hypothetical protein
MVKLCTTFIVHFLTGNNSTKMHLIKYWELLVYEVHLLMYE